MPIFSPISYMNQNKNPQQNQYLQGNPTTDPNAQTSWMNDSSSDSNWAKPGFSEQQGQNLQNGQQFNQSSGLLGNGTALSSLAGGNTGIIGGQSTQPPQYNPNPWQPSFSNTGVTGGQFGQGQSSYPDYTSIDPNKTYTDYFQNYHADDRDQVLQRYTDAANSGYFQDPTNAQFAGGSRPPFTNGGISSFFGGQQGQQQSVGSGATGAYMPEGYDITKFNDPNKHDPKYDIGRILSKYAPGPEGLQKAMGELGRMGISQVGKDSINVPGLGVIDVGRAFGAGGGGWQWLPQMTGSSNAPINSYLAAGQNTEMTQNQNWQQSMNGLMQQLFQQQQRNKFNKFKDMNINSQFSQQKGQFGFGSGQNGMYF